MNQFFIIFISLLIGFLVFNKINENFDYASDIEYTDYISPYKSDTDITKNIYYNQLDYKPVNNINCCLVQTEYLPDPSNQFGGNFKYKYKKMANEECDLKKYRLDNNKQLFIDGYNGWTNDRCEDNLAKEKDKTFSLGSSIIVDDGFSFSSKAREGSYSKKSLDFSEYLAEEKVKTFSAGSLTIQAKPELLSSIIDFESKDSKLLGSFSKKSLDFSENLAKEKDKTFSLGSCRNINKECIDFVDKEYCDKYHMTWSIKTCRDPLEYKWIDKINFIKPESKNDGSYIMFNKKSQMASNIK
jgi:hypothetical protein